MPAAPFAHVELEAVGSIAILAARAPRAKSSRPSDTAGLQRRPRDRRADARRRLHPRPRGRVRARRPSGDPRRGHAILPGPRASFRPSAAGDPNVLVGPRVPRVRGPLIVAMIVGVQPSADETLLEHGVLDGAAAIRQAQAGHSNRGWSSWRARQDSTARTPRISPGTDRGSGQALDHESSGPSNRQRLNLAGASAGRCSETGRVPGRLWRHSGTPCDVSERKAPHDPASVPSAQRGRQARQGPRCHTDLSVELIRLAPGEPARDGWPADELAAASSAAHLMNDIARPAGP